VCKELRKAGFSIVRKTTAEAAEPIVSRTKDSEGEDGAFV